MKTMNQKQALDILKMGNNVFLTGPAGSGKTYVLNQYISYLKEHNVAIGITASTGIAATHINGMTIHSWSGIGIKDVLHEKDLKALLEKVHLRMRFIYAKVLIIDEISMLHGYRLDMVDKVCRAFTFKDEPFGGLQVIMCGDFFQLPPITRPGEKGGFAYEAEVWNNMNLKVCYLDEQYRQADGSFLSVLNDIRNSRVTEDTIDLLTSRLNKDIDNTTVPTKLFTHNVDVDTINATELTHIDTHSYVFRMSGTGKKELIDVMKKACLAPEELVLKKGAIVMFVKNNYDKGYVNGTLGEVIDFGLENYPIVRTLDGREIQAKPEAWAVEDEGVIKAEVKQVPLRLAWAITIHKSQGMSLDAAVIDLSKSFVPGMGYVALSRVRTLEGMKLTGINNMALMVNPDVSEMDKEFHSLSDDAQGELYKLVDSEKEDRQLKYIRSIRGKK
jgi:ATP-dependent exoDNAse (exonuclease V) alpha subunit